MSCGKEGHKKADCKFQTDLRAVCRNTNTHETEKDADEPSQEVTVEAVWCMAVRDTVDDGLCDGIEKHDVSSEHRDESKVHRIPRTSRRMKIHEEFCHEHRDGSKLKKSHHEHRDGIEMDEQDRHRRPKSGHE